MEGKKEVKTKTEKMRGNRTDITKTIPDLDFIDRRIQKQHCRKRQQQQKQQNTKTEEDNIKNKHNKK